MLAIIDYGVGNLFSLKSSLDAIGTEALVTSDEAVIASADQLILPGVGAFEDAAAKLRQTGMADVVRREAQRGKPIMGICLGMQLLLEKSFEYGEHEGLGLIPGNVRPIADVIPAGFKIPHIGWNAISFPAYQAEAATADSDAGCVLSGGKKSPVFKYIDEGAFMYFVHSYYAADCAEHTIAVTEYGAPLTAAVARDNVFGCQFHPEKSGETGLKILRAFCEMK